MKRLSACGVARSDPRRISIAQALVLGLSLVAGSAQAKDSAQLVPERISYNVEDPVRLKVVFPDPRKSQPPRPGVQISLERPVDLAVSLRYVGANKPILEEVPLAKSFLASKSDYSTGYQQVWEIPENADTGRYEVDLITRNSETHEIISSREKVASFAVHRKLVRIRRIELDKTFYTSGDSVQCRATIENLTNTPLSGLRVEFSERHWPWIAPPSNTESPAMVTLAEEVSLGKRAEVDLKSGAPLVAKAVGRPTVQQYGVIVWDRERKNVLDIVFSPLVFIQPPGLHSPKPYPLHYVYPELSQVNTSSYREFDSPSHSSAAIQFNRAHTMFPAAGQAAVQFGVRNPTEVTWPGVSIHASLRSLGSAGFGEKTLAESVDLEARAPALEKEVTFALPADGGGLFRVVVQVKDKSGKIVAESGLEIASNPLPKSILIFCAHEDDEMAHGGIIRAAVENRIPLELVYFTSGDAGSCDRYYEHSCSPAEALNFGALRMDEARAALAHLGVSREHIHFLGLPDGGSEQIWKYHIEPSHPYRSVLLATDHAPYEGLARPNLPYARKSAVEAAKEFIRKFQPEVIFAGHPDERHVDHRTNNWFVVKALQELLPERAISPDIKLLVDQVYGPQADARAPYKYEKHVLNVSGEARARWQEAVWFYQSQFGNRALGNLRTFSKLPRTEVHQQVLDWKEHEGWNEKD